MRRGCDFSMMIVGLRFVVKAFLMYLSSWYVLPSGQKDGLNPSFSLHHSDLEGDLAHVGPTLFGFPVCMVG